MMDKLIASVVGARPQFVKAAPVSRALRRVFQEGIIYTGQHYDYGMSEVFFKEMDMHQPDFNLGVGGGAHGDQTGRMLIELEKIFMTLKPDCVLVYGDTNSTLAGALAAVKLGIPLVHVEAGLRSYNRSMPEEINRVLTDHVSTLLFCPTDAAVSNLANEGIINGVHRVGDVMYDALLHNLELSRKNSAILQRLGLTKKEFALATVHRAANTDDRSRMQALLSAFGSLDVHVVFPVHPRTQKMMREWGIPAESNVKLIEPVGYFDMLALLENANCVLTDSGGVQKEAYLVGTRCITLREETEWVETVEAGWNKLAGTNPDTIRSLFVSWFPTGERVLLYGNGNAADEIAAVIQQVLG